VYCKKARHHIKKKRICLLIANNLFSTLFTHLIPSLSAVFAIRPAAVPYCLAGVTLPAWYMSGGGAEGADAKGRVLTHWHDTREQCGCIGT
jgi:hypothetical protein